MREPSLLEAASLLERPLICDDPEDWRTARLQPNMSRIECGLIAADGSRSGLQVQLLFSEQPRTKLVEFKFSVFRRQLGALQRVYQLQVNPQERVPRSKHDYPHEHLGDKRIQGEPEWLMWGFEEALAYFCERTNITFLPPIKDPRIFELKP